MSIITGINGSIQGGGSGSPVYPSTGVSTSSNFPT